MFYFLGEFYGLVERLKQDVEREDTTTRILLSHTFQSSVNQVLEIDLEQIQTLSSSDHGNFISSEASHDSQISRLFWQLPLDSTLIQAENTRAELSDDN